MLHLVGGGRLQFEPLPCDYPGAMNDANAEHEPNTDEPNADVRVRLLEYPAAAALLGLTPDAVRMRCVRGALVCQTVGGRRRVVWPQPEHDPNEPETERRSRSVRSGADGLAAALELRLAETQHDRDRWRESHADLSRQLEVALQLAAAANASLERERERVAALESRLARVAAIAPPSAETPTAASAGVPPGTQIEPPGAAEPSASTDSPSVFSPARLRAWWRRPRHPR